MVERIPIGPNAHAIQDLSTRHANGDRHVTTVGDRDQAPIHRKIRRTVYCERLATFQDKAILRAGHRPHMECRNRDRESDLLRNGRGDAEARRIDGTANGCRESCPIRIGIGSLPNA
jgi:hypothetical protein